MAQLNDLLVLGKTSLVGNVNLHGPTLVSNHIYLTGAVSNSSVNNTSQIVFGTPTDNHVAITSNTNTVIINPNTTSATNQVLLRVGGVSKFPGGIECGPLTGVGSVSFNRLANSNIGDYSTTFGYDTSASGNYSHAEGYYTIASGSAAHAEGYGTTIAVLITGEASATTYILSTANSDIKVNQVIKYNNIYAKINSYDSSTLTITVDKTLSDSALSNVSATIYCNVAFGIYSHTEGYDTIACGDYSHAEGYDTIASGESSHTEGINTKASGRYSHSEGQSTKASGWASHAEGQFTTASGSRSHAEGYDTIASGYGSHAEGYYTKVSRDYAHAEGANTIASGEASHAEGDSTGASGDYSHAEGSYVVSFGNGSHAEGNYTVASGLASHAEGVGGTTGVSITGEASATTYTLSAANSDIKAGQVICYKYKGVYAKITSYTSSSRTITVDKTLSDSALNGASATIYLYAASGSYSHIEGYRTIASGSASHAEGYNSVASGSRSHAEGYNTTASGNYSHAEGSDTTASGLYSHAEGYNTTANSKSQHTQGEYNILDTANASKRGTYAHIVGNGTSKNKRSNAHTLDWSGNAWFAGDVYVGSTSGTNKDNGSVALMKSVNPTGTGSFSLNRKINTTIGSYSVAEGYNTTAAGYGSHAEGSHTIASGENSHAEGSSVVAYGNTSHAEGGGGSVTVSITGPASATSYALSAADSNIKAGQVICCNNAYAKVNSYNSSSLTITVDKTLSSSSALNGAIATIYLYGASGNYSHTEGYQTIASGICSHTEGYKTAASGDYSHVEGYQTDAKSNYSHAEGQNSLATGDAAHAEGANTTTKGNYSHAEGNYTTASSQSQHVQGEYNVLDTTSASARGTYAHIVGNGTGTSTSQRSNAHTLDWSGNAWFAGNVYVGSTGGKNKDSGSKKLATTDDVAKAAKTVYNQTIPAQAGNEAGDIVYPLLAREGIQIVMGDETISTGTTESYSLMDAHLTSEGHLHATKVYGAVWNDYAEYRQTHHKVRPGQCVYEKGDGSLAISYERMMPGANIVSDTFGFAIGETNKCKTPLAVSGRVLAYPYEPKETYNPGDAVCSGPNGTISKMTRAEIRDYPERIVGTVSEIPVYEVWGSGNVKVNGRIWIKVR